jgi:hypothetical protein
VYLSPTTNLDAAMAEPIRGVVAYAGKSRSDRGAIGHPVQKQDPKSYIYVIDTIRPRNFGVTVDQSSAGVSQRS